MQDQKSKLFTDEEMATVRQTDLPNLLASLGYQVTNVGQFQSTKEMDSLRIKNRRTFYRYSEGVGGDAITFLEHYHNMTFEKAVRHLLEFNGQARERSTVPDIPAPTKTVAPEEKAEFKLPEANEDNRRVFAYLLKRGISREAISQLIKVGLLYEDKEHHNCVFVGKDKNGKATFSYKRGTYDKDSAGFKGDVPGSDKNVAFRLPINPNQNEVYVFESPVDLLSYQCVTGEPKSNAVALCCLHDGALEQYLKENPQIQTIHLRLDGDKWGKEATRKYLGKYKEQGYTVTAKFPFYGKDWNEYLQKRKKRQLSR